ncbi:hypothetical protein K490DRAFT_64953 [Saccharata proteae CBS 121410]|uniref:Uncharacterized protein n=1 Tax=Saccharata proteae CBS 121410 TaxID=1314787 RepID=A0A9P4LY01_9PEZI|nr:hypothetical protein K490DRAFT_64953 [Saccharata proteae CBS 121410]
MAGNQGNDDTKDGTVRPASRSDRSGTPTPGPRLSSPMIQDSDSDSQNVTSVKPNQQNVNDEEEEEQSDPTEELAEFDWTDLQERYHDAMKKLQAEETQIGIEFTDLMKFFELWAQTTAAHEVDRSFTRLMTRSAHVRISEAQLEEKRQHYMKVVNAFQSALNLLNAP